MEKSAKMAGKMGQKWASEERVFEPMRMVIGSDF